MNDSTRFTQAIVRRPGADIGGGLTTADLGAPDHKLALEQFDRYVEALGACGLSVQILDALPGFPDAHFVEDTAVVTPEVAVITRPGAEARRGETVSMAPALAPYRPLQTIEMPGTLDGGDVLIVDRHVLIGLSDRTNENGAQQLGAILEPFGYTWQAVPVGEGLHFKSSVNLVAPGTLAVTSAFASAPALSRYTLLEIPDAEAYACNVLLLGDRLLVPSGYRETSRLLAGLDHEIITLDTSEFCKMDGGLTCLSLRF